MNHLKLDIPNIEAREFIVKIIQLMNLKSIDR
jgi:hypothetical protein